ncbi:MAG: GFA family protein [Lysobacter sp.]
MIESKVLGGGCHCGKVRVELATAIPLANLSPRACDCSFCTKHGASYLSDPDGSLVIAVNGQDTISEYHRQGSESARFLVCRDCGVLVAVVFDEAAGRYGAVNSRCLEGDAAFAPLQTGSPQQLTAEEKKRRWTRLWTPRVKLTITGG